MVSPLLVAASLVASTPAAPPAHAPHADALAATIAAAIDEAATRYRLPPDLIRAVIATESGGVAFDAAGRPLVSSAGAVGLMQLMPGTYRDVAMAEALGTDPGNLRDNILAGSAYLRALHDRFGSPGFLAAYNAGPGRWIAHLAGAPLPAETQTYLAKLAPWFGNAAPIVAEAGSDTLFLQTRRAAAGPAPGAGGGLFFPLRRDAEKAGRSED